MDRTKDEWGAQRARDVGASSALQNPRLLNLDTISRPLYGPPTPGPNINIVQNDFSQRAQIQASGGASSSHDSTLQLSQEVPAKPSPPSSKGQTLEAPTISRAYLPELIAKRIDKAASA